MSDMECFSLDSLTRFLLSSASTWLSTHTHTKTSRKRRSRKKKKSARECRAWLLMDKRDMSLLDWPRADTGGTYDISSSRFLEIHTSVTKRSKMPVSFLSFSFFFWFFLTFLFGHLLLKSVVHSFSFCWWWCQYNGRHYCDTPSPFVPATSLTLSIHLQTVTRIKSVRKVK